MIVLRILWLPAAVTLLICGWLWLDHLMGWHGPRVVWLGVTLVIAGLLLISWCFALFFFRGKGSPHPFVAKTKYLVPGGPYAVVRNPMMWGVGMSLAGLCFWFGSVGLWFGTACFVLFVNLFVRFYEERDMERRFGEEYRAYCRQVPRWWPRLRRSRAKSAAASR